MPLSCLVGETVDRIKQAFSTGELDPDSLMDISSAERRAKLANIIGEENVHEVNSLIESKLLLKNQKQGIINAIKSMTGIGETDKSELIKLKADRLNEYLDPQNMDKYLSDLAQDKVNRQFKLGISDDEVKTIIESTRDIEKAKVSIPENSPKGSEERIKYGLKLATFQDYIGGLKKEAQKLTWKQFIFRPGEWINTIGGSLKSAVASLDNSFFGRQGIKTLYTNPKTWGRAFYKSWEDIGKQIAAKGKWYGSGDDAVMLAIKSDILSRPNAINGKYKAGNFAVGIETEEAFPTSLPEMVPILGRLFKASEIAYNGAALRMRADLADKVIAAAEMNGVNTLDKSEAKFLGDVVNGLTGRGNIGKAAVLGKELNAGFFSIRFLKSNIETLTDPFIYTAKKIGFGEFKNKGEEFAKKQAAKNSLRIFGTIAALLTTAKLIDPNSTDLDPNSTQFGKIKVGGVSFDITGGMGSFVTLIARITPQYRNGEWGFYTKNYKGEVTKLNADKYGARSALDVIEDFWEGKLAPLTAIARDVWKGKDFEGNVPTPLSVTEGATAPMIIQNYEQLRNDPNVSNTIAPLILDFLGISISNYNYKTKSKKSEYIKT